MGKEKSVNRSGEFQEIGHSGGQVTFTVSTTEDGTRQYQVGWQHSRPTPAAIFSIYALPQGIPVGVMRLMGMGVAGDPPPLPNCVPVFISSDSEGKFGHQCPRCRGYWRSRSGGGNCPYCALKAPGHQFLTDAQRLFVKRYCDRLADALEQSDDGQHVIDMDPVADAVGKDCEKPPFYYAEEKQQNQFTCTACNEFNDVIGRFAYCSACGTRNDLDELERKILPSIRDRINAGEATGSIKEIASAFDSFVSQYVREMLRRIPMRTARRNKLERMRFLDLDQAVNSLRQAFEIDICEGFRDAELSAARLMFHRRHVYEHNGGEVDEKYLRDSGDASVRLKQALRETQESAHNFASLVGRMAANLHKGFHDIFPPDPDPIAEFDAERSICDPESISCFDLLVDLRQALSPRRPRAFGATLPSREGARASIDARRVGSDPFSESRKRPRPAALCASADPKTAPHLSRRRSPVTSAESEGRLMINSSVHGCPHLRTVLTRHDRGAIRPRESQSSASPFLSFFVISTSPSLLIWVPQPVMTHE